MPRPTSRNPTKTKHLQVGMMMRSYRESFVKEDGRRGITQSELLRRMAVQDPYFDMRGSHGTVSRWESGQTTPTVERLEAFGRALNLSDEEIEGLILLAGLDPSHEERRTLSCTKCGGGTETVHIEVMASVPGAEATKTAAKRSRRCLECGQVGESSERWTNEPEELAHNRMQQVLQNIGVANDQIRRALVEANQVQSQQPRDARPPGEHLNLE